MDDRAFNSLFFGGIPLVAGTGLDRRLGRRPVLGLVLSYLPALAAFGLL